MDIQHLRVFLAVAEELHFGRAAERLHLTASPVSRTVKDLEKELQAELFVRRYHQVELTEVGRALADKARPILEEFDGLRAVARQAQDSSQRILRVAGAHLAPPALMDRFVSIAEEVTGGAVDVRLAMSSVLIPEVLSGDLDAALVHLPVEDDRLGTLVVGEFPFSIVMRADDPLADRSELRLSDLAHRTVTMPELTTQPAAIRHLYEVMAAGGVTSLQRLPDSDAFMIASHVRRTRGLTLATDPALGGPAQIYADPAFRAVPIVHDTLRFVLGVAWLREARPADELVEKLLSRVEVLMPPAVDGG